MFEEITKLWEKHGFLVLVVGSVLFFLVCWLLGWKPKKGRAGKISDYMRDIMAVEKPKKKRNPKKTEDRCREIVEDIFQKPFPSARPDFLKNPATGRNLECDMMNPQLKLCIERNGEQHYKHVDHFHTAGEYGKQLERDALKQKLLANQGYTLVTIPYTIHYDVLDRYIPYKLAQDPRWKPYVDAYNQRQQQGNRG